MRIDSRRELEEWIAENNCFQDACIEALEPLPAKVHPAQVARAELRLSMQTGGSIVAGQLRQIRRFKIIAAELSEFALEGGFAAGHCCEGADVLDVAQPVALSLDVPGLLRMVCNSLEITMSDHSEVVPRFLNTTEFSVEASGQAPSPAEWLVLFHSRGTEVAWRCYGGSPVDADAVPSLYEGWFLQLPQNFEAEHGGLFFRSLGRTPTGFRMTVSLWASGEQRLSSVAAEIASTFQAVAVRCGNAELDASEWSRALDELRAGGGA